ncbi:MAG TPA: TonB-dependent receptor [Candidatus Kapabacteria bacterium]|nr:TonB-dependent receptor [Candidatus Kapabacteria bacterium]
MYSFLPNNLFRTLCVLGMLAVFLGSNAMAQTGKIKATITDKKTGEGLLNATVQILETRQGAKAKGDGTAIIINVSPSENYTLVAKYAGYEPQTIKNVKVQSNITTELTFKLSTAASDTIIVTGRQLVEKTKTVVGVHIDNKELTSTAGVTNLDQASRLTTGVVKDANSGGLSIHGAKGSDNSTRFNGIETSDVVGGRNSVIGSAVSSLAVSEQTITTAGADASQGNTIGGVISTSTKAAGLNFELTAHYRTEVPALFGTSGNGYKQLGSGDKIYELAFGGPLFSDEVKYFITAKGNTRDYYNYAIITTYYNSGLDVKDPYGLSTAQLPYTGYYTRSATGKLTFDVLGFHLSADAVLASTSRQTNGVPFQYADPAEYGAYNELQNLYTLKGNTALGEGGADGLIDFTVGYERYSLHSGKYDQIAGGGLFKFYHIFESADKYTYDDNNHTITEKPDGIPDIYTPVSKQIPDPQNPGSIKTLSGAGLNPFTGHVEGPAITNSTANPYGLLNIYPVAGNFTAFTNNTRDHYQIQGSYNNQYGSHLINFGFEAHSYTLTDFNNNLPWDPTGFKDSFVIKPLIAAVYVGDKMEFSDITFNPSLRFDLYNPANDHALVDPQNPFDPVTHKPRFKTAPVQTQLSPRLGITYAVTDQTTFDFNYGLFFKQPLFGDVLSNTGDLARVLQRGNQIIGNGSLKAEHTQEFSVGFNTQLSEQLAMSIHGIYKDFRNLPGLSTVSSDNLAIGYTLYSDDQYGNYKGVELSFEKRMADHYSVRVNYTYSIAKGTSSTATENYSLLINGQGGSPDDPNVVLPLQPFPLNFDRTHVAQLLFNAGFGASEGPSIFGTQLFQDLNLSTTTEYYSGTPYTKTDIKGKQAGEFNADRNPAYFQTDAALTRTIRLQDLFGSMFGANNTLQLQLEVVNLLNTTSAITVYPATGQGDDDGLLQPYTGTYDFINDPTDKDNLQIDALGKLKYNSLWDLNKDGRVSVQEQTQAYVQNHKDNLARRTNFQIPRRVYFNVTLSF